jgi:hypothetical protein
MINALAKRSGIRQIERMTGVHRDTIMRFGVRVGQGCAGWLNRTMRDLPYKQLQLDEICGKRERRFCRVADLVEASA